MIRQFFHDGLHWMVIVGFILGFAIYNITAGAGGAV